MFIVGHTLLSLTVPLPMLHLLMLRFLLNESLSTNLGTLKSGENIDDSFQLVPVV